MPADDFRKMQIPWRYNLPRLKEVLAELNPGPSRERHVPPEELQKLWDELLKDSNGIETQAIKPPVNHCLNVWGCGAAGNFALTGSKARHIRQ